MSHQSPELIPFEQNEGVEEEMESIARSIAEEKDYDLRTYQYHDYKRGVVVTQFVDEHIGPDKGFHKDRTEIGMRPDVFSEDLFESKCHDCIKIIEEDRHEHGLE